MIVENLELMDLMDSLERLANLVHAATLVVMESTVFQVVLVDLDLQATRDGWVPQATPGRRVNGVPKDTQGLEGTKAQQVFLENRALKALRGRWARWDIKANKARPVSLDHLVAMGPKVHQVQLVTRALLDPPDHLPSRMTWPSTTTLPRLNISEPIVLTNPMAHANFQRERANIWRWLIHTFLTDSTGLTPMPVASKMQSKSTVTFGWVRPAWHQRQMTLKSGLTQISISVKSTGFMNSRAVNCLNIMCPKISWPS